MLDSSGYLKIIDFDTACRIDDSATMAEICGTEEYKAPEMFRCAGYDQGVDFWAIGILIYEMLFGRTPFHSPEISRVPDLIQSKNLEFPERCEVPYSLLLEDLITKLLIKSPFSRLGHQNGA
mmetsp:Transcript_27875/g.34595  ORF Transcript_27875/g.34595 Transcript_27875/m.34595 type:complete len:122 (+) Transcript_27875:547-912(+)